MVWTFFGHDPKFPRLRRLFNIIVLTIIIGGAAFAGYWFEPWINGTLLPVIQELFGNKAT